MRDKNALDGVLFQIVKQRLKLSPCTPSYVEKKNEIFELLTSAVFDFEHKYFVE